MECTSESVRHAVDCSETNYELINRPCYFPGQKEWRCKAVVPLNLRFKEDAGSDVIGHIGPLSWRDN
jgi:hypothetical protein